MMPLSNTLWITYLIHGMEPPLAENRQSLGVDEIMHGASPMVEIHRGDFLESLHCGHGVVANARGEVLDSWGDEDCVILPRSSAKMIQALSLIHI